MKRNLQFIVSASTASLLVCSALAQDTYKPKPDRPDYSRHGQSHEQRTDRLNGAAKSSDLIGMTVNNYQNEKLGKVEDLAVDVESGRVVQVILSTGGFLGVGDTLTAVPPGALHHDVPNKVLHLDADKAKLTSAPKFEMAKWAECCDEQHVSAVYKHYGQEPAYRFINKGDAPLGSQRKTDSQRNADNVRNAEVQRNASGQPNTDTVRNADGQPNADSQRNATGQPYTDTVRNADGQRNADNVRNADGQRHTDGSPNTVATRNADGTWGKDRLSDDSQTMIPAARLGKSQRASKLTGMAVQNLQAEKLGDVENLLVDLSSGRIVAVVVSSGGFLGLGDELSAVPPTALRFNAERDTLQLDTTKEKLASSPHFKSNQWPDFAQPSYADGVYRAYKVQPYFTTNVTADADNTARNVRDRNDATLTPLDQGNSKADVATTAQIRKEINAGKSMSSNAKNVKIITKDGQVTLRGPVNSAEEKRLIGEIANRIAQAANVNNQLEVKINTTSN